MFLFYYFYLASTTSQFLNFGVSSRTSSLYKSYLRYWSKFLLTVTAHSSSLSPTHNWNNQSREYQLQVIISFIRYLRENIKLEQERISKCITSLHHYFRIQLFDVSVFAEEVVSLAIRACRIDKRSHSVVRELRKRLPFTIDMIDTVRENYWEVSSEYKGITFLDRRMTFVGILMAFTFMLRVSEYVFDTRSNHAIRSEDVQFFIKNYPCEPIHSFEIKDKNIILENVLMVRIILRTSKTDQGGRGKYLFIQPRSQREIFCMNTIYVWCNLSSFRKGDPFLSRRFNGTQKLLTSRMVSTAIKESACKHGLQRVQHLFSTHSLRIGGATSLIASGVDRETIQRIGNWKVSSGASDSIYELNNTHDNNLWSSVTRNSYNSLHSDDIKYIIPPAHSSQN